MQKILTLPQPKSEKLKKVTIGNKHHRKLLVLFDLDETLVHCTGPIKTSKTQYQNEVEVKLPMGKKVKISINIRPFLEKSLKLIKKYYTVALYTASHQSYTDAVLDLIDPDKKFFDYRLYRYNCLPMNIEDKDFFIKDLSIIEDYPIEKIIIIDNSVLSFAYHLRNSYCSLL